MDVLTSFHQNRQQDQEVQEPNRARVVTANVSGRHATVGRGPAWIPMTFVELASFSLAAAQPRQNLTKRNLMNVRSRVKTEENVILLWGKICDIINS